MSRLIDENSVIENAEKCAFTDKDDRRRFLEFVKYCVKEAPTAYDIEKVVAELDNAESVKVFGSLNSGNRLIPVSEAIEIVKRGGAE